jgi:phosphoglycolate phosphatase-like HAD superfamily hydrolase
MIYIFDIDGTLSDGAHRRHLVEDNVLYQQMAASPKDWEAFYAASADDKPIFEVITVARALEAAEHGIIYSTGRPESIRFITTQWLRKYRVPNGPIYMRTDKDHRESFVVKSELLDRIKAQYTKEIGGAFEDRQQDADMYRARGLRVFQVAEGKF